MLLSKTVRICLVKKSILEKLFRKHDDIFGFLVQNDI